MAAPVPLAGSTHWRDFVRDTLEELQRRLESHVELSMDASGEWPVIRGTLRDGRQVVMPFGKGVVCAPPPLARTPKNILSPWTIRDHRSEGVQINIPWWAIRRDKGWIVDLRRSAQRGGHSGSCAGWPSIALRFTDGVDFTRTPFLHPRAVIVLQVREGRENADYGWYVRTRGSRELVEVPHEACVALAYVMRSNPAYDDAELLETASKVDQVRPQPQLFHGIAVAAHGAYRERVREANQAWKAGSKKRLRGAAVLASPPRSPPPTETCVVCLEECETSPVRCRPGTCSAKVCEVCNSDARGLCVICDRGSINSVYPCGRCFELTPLREYGYNCLSCDDSNLCKGCYTSFRECCSCESF